MSNDFSGAKSVKTQDTISQYTCYHFNINLRIYEAIQLLSYSLCNW